MKTLHQAGEKTPESVSQVYFLSCQRVCSRPPSPSPGIWFAPPDPSLFHWSMRWTAVSRLGEHTCQCQSNQYTMTLKTQLFTGACNEQQHLAWVNIHVSAIQPSMQWTWPGFSLEYAMNTSDSPVGVSQPCTLFTAACNEQQHLTWVNSQPVSVNQYAMNIRTQPVSVNLACNEPEDPAFHWSLQWTAVSLRVNIHVSVGQPSILWTRRPQLWSMQWTAASCLGEHTCQCQSTL